MGINLEAGETGDVRESGAGVVNTVAGGTLAPLKLCLASCRLQARFDAVGYGD